MLPVVQRNARGRAAAPSQNAIATKAKRRYAAGIVSRFFCSHPGVWGASSMCRTALDARLICTWRIDLARIERFSIMKIRRTSRSAARGLRRTISVYHLVGAALPLALSGCSSDDPCVDDPQPSPDVSMSAPAPSAPAEAPAAEGSNEENAPVMDGVTPVATPGEGQQVTDLAMPEPEPGGAAEPSGDPGAAGAPSVSPTGCVGQAWPTANPTSPGPFEVTADRDIGPQAGIVPDRIFGNVQQRFNIYRPSDLATSGLCHPILVWANGTGDNPEQRPPECIVEPSTNTWCGTYPGLMNQLASHGFVVLASLSTDTAAGDPLPTITGLDWLLEQAEDPSSPYFHRLDTTRVGALGHSQGGASTSIAAADPRISAIATIHGSRALNGLHGPALFICGEQDTVVPVCRRGKYVSHGDGATGDVLEQPGGRPWQLAGSGRQPGPHLLRAHRLVQGAPDGRRGQSPVLLR